MSDERPPPPAEPPVYPEALLRWGFDCMECGRSKVVERPKGSGVWICLWCGKEDKP